MEIEGDHFMQAAAFTDYWNNTEIQENAHLQSAEDECFTLDEIASQIYTAQNKKTCCTSWSKAVQWFRSYGPCPGVMSR